MFGLAVARGQENHCISLQAMAKGTERVMDLFSALQHGISQLRVKNSFLEKC